MADEPRYRDRAAAIALADGHVLVIRRNHPRYGEYYVYPGGGIDPGEKPVDAVRREVREETGLQVAVGREIMYGTTPQGHLQHYFLVETPMLPVALPSTAEENTPERMLRRGTYEPMWIPTGEIAEMPLQPLVVTHQLLEYIVRGFPEWAVDVGSLYPQERNA